MMRASPPPPPHLCALHHRDVWRAPTPPAGGCLLPAPPRVRCVPDVEGHGAAVDDDVAHVNNLLRGGGQEVARGSLARA